MILYKAYHFAALNLKVLFEYTWTLKFRTKNEENAYKDTHYYV